MIRISQYNLLDQYTETKFAMRLGYLRVKLFRALPSRDCFHQNKINRFQTYIHMPSISGMKFRLCKKIHVKTEEIEFILLFHFSFPLIPFQVIILILSLFSQFTFLFKCIPFIREYIEMADERNKL